MGFGRMRLFCQMRGENLGSRWVELVEDLMRHGSDELPSSGFALSGLIDGWNEIEVSTIFSGEKRVFLPKKGLIPDARSRRFSRSISHGKL